MLISFARRFIYLKTVKTGSTAVEFYFQPECVDPGVQVERKTPMLIGERGVVGARGKSAPDSRYRNHITATELRPKVIEDFGQQVWDASLKFCVVRNPYERAVSMFWMRTPDAEKLANAPFADVRAAFQAACQQRWAVTASESKYLIDGQPVVDMFIRHRAMAEDVEAVCHRLGVPFEPARLERVNGRRVDRLEPARAYYDNATAEMIGRLERWEAERFGFTLQDAQ